MRTAIVFTLFLVLSTAVVTAQPRPMEKEAKPAVIKLAPAEFEARYEGGLFGFSDKEKGTLKFDDENQRLVFFDKDKSEKFGIPYGSLLVVSPQSTSVTSNTGNVVRNIPLPGAGIAGAFIKEKRRYMVLQFNDPDADARGIVNFKIDNKELLDSAIDSLGKKAKLTQRGDAYYRPRPVPET